MNKEQKTATIEEIAAQIEGAEAIFAVDYRGISVPQAAELRSKLREADASFRVVKNRLTKLAAKQAGEERLDEFLQGPTALTFVRGDTALAAKTLSTFNREADILTFKGGFMEGLSLDEERFKSIARLPGRDVLNGQLAGIVASPITGLVRGLGSMIQGLALQLGQIAEKGLVSGEAPSGSAAGPVAEEGTSSAQASEEEPTTAPPADEAGEASADSSAEETSIDSSEEEPSEPEGDDTAEEPAAEETAAEETADDEETSDSEDDESKEEE
jgi:large subunit ribosomal protein L10